MSFTRVNGAGWATGALLSSTQMNALDSNVEDALDKVGGDTATGAVTFTGGVAVTTTAMTCTSGLTVSGTQLTCSAGFTCNGTCAFGATAAVTHASGSTDVYASGAGLTCSAGSTVALSGTVNMNGTFTLSGAMTTSVGGYIARKADLAADADTLYSPTNIDVLYVDAGLTNNRIYTFTKTGISSGACIRIYSAEVTFTATIKDESGTTLAVVRKNTTSGQYKWVDICRFGGGVDSWLVVGGQLNP